MKCSLQKIERVFRVEVLILLVWCLYFAVRALAPLSDPDTPWHLATGEYILVHHQIPTTDPFSWSMRGQPWVTQEWLFEVVLAWLANHFGFSGIWGLTVILQTVTVLVVYRLCSSLSSGQRVFSALAAVIAIAAGMAFWVVRPQMVSYMMFAIFLLILRRVREGRVYYLLFVPPLVLIWANAHASVSIGILMLLFEVAVSFVPTIGRLQAVPLPNRTRVCLVLTAVVSVALGLLNPNHVHEFTYALLSNNSLMTNSINEWHSPNFHSDYYKYGVIPFLAGVLLITILRYRPVPIQYVLYFGGCFAITLVYQRFMPYLAIAGAPLLASMTFDWLRVLLRPSRPFRYVCAILMLGAVVDFATKVPQVQGSVESHMNAGAYPVNAVNYLIEHQVPGPLLNAYDFGGYLIYRGVPTFVDGRTDIFLQSSVFQDYMDLQNLAWDAPYLLTKYNFQSAILPPGYALSVYLLNNPDWTVVYQGTQADVFVKKHTASTSSAPL